MKRVTALSFAVVAAMAVQANANITVAPQFFGGNPAETASGTIASGTGIIIADVDGSVNGTGKPNTTGNPAFDAFFGTFDPSFDPILNNPIVGDSFPESGDIVATSAINNGQAFHTASNLVPNGDFTLPLDPGADYVPTGNSFDGHELTTTNFYVYHFASVFDPATEGPGEGVEYAVYHFGPYPTTGNFTQVSDGTFVGFLTTIAQPPANPVAWVGGVDANWSTAGNWDTAVPVADDQVIFNSDPATTTLNYDLADGLLLNGITFEAGAGEFTIDPANPGDGITLGGGQAITNNAGNTQTINIDIATDGDATFDAGDGVLVFGGEVAITGDTLTVDTGNSGNADFTGTLVGDTSSVFDVTGNRTELGFDATAFDGTIRVSGGKLQFGVDFGPNPTFDGDESWEIAGGTLDADTGATFTIAGDTMITGDFAIDEGTPIAIDAGAATTLAGGIRTITVNDINDPFQINSDVTGDGSGDDEGIIKAGVGAMALAGANTFAGGVQLDAGTLQVGNDAGLGTGAFTVNGGTVETIGGNRDLTNPITIGDTFTVGDGDGAHTLTFSGAATVSGDATMNVDNADGTTFDSTIDLASNTFTVASDNPVNLNGAVTGDNTLAKTGTGTLTLAGDSTSFTGTLDVDGGTVDLPGGGSIAGDATVDNATLNVDGSVGGIATVNAGGNLTGTGTIGTVDVTGGTVAPGNSIGTLAITNGITFDAASTYAVDVRAQADGGGSDLLSVGGTALFNSGATIDVSQFGGVAEIGIAEVFTIVSASDFGATDINQINLNSNIGGTSFELNISGGTDLQLLVNPTVTWTGAGNGTEWADPTNWDNDPQLNDQDLGSQVLVFGANGTSGTLNADLGLGGIQDFTGIGGITFADQSGPFTLQGGELAFIDAANMTNNSANTATIDNDLAAGNDNLTLNANTAGFDVNGDVDLSSGGDLNVTGANDTSLDGVISGSGGLNKSGAGTLDVTNGNTYAGDTTVQGGTLNLTGSVDSPVIVDGGTLILGNDAAIDAGQSLTLNSGAIQSDNDARDIGNSVVVGGDFTVNAGNDLTLSGDVDLGGATRTVTVDNSQTTLSGVVSNGGITKDGDGWLVLQGTNTFTGDVTINGGRVRANAANAIEDSVAVIVGAAGQFDLLGSSEAIGSLAGDAGGLVDLNARTLTLGGNDSDTEFAGQIAGGTVESKVVKVGTGNFTLSGDSTHGGTTAVQGGTLTLTGTIDNDLVVDGGMAVLGNDNGIDGAAALAINSGTIESDDDARNLANAVTVAGDFTVGGTNDLELSGGMDFGDLGGNPRTVTVSNTGTTVFSGNIDASNGTLVKDGPGRLNLTADNTLASITADLQVDAGTLGLGDENAVGSGTLILNGGTIQSLGGPFTIDNAVAVDNDSVIDTNGNDMTVTGVVTGSANLDKQGSGALNLDADSDPSFSGDINLNAGSLGIGQSDALGSGELNISGGTTILAVGPDPVTIDNTVNVNGDFSIGGSTALEITGLTSLNFGDVNSGTRTVTVDNTETTTWSAVVNASNGTIAKAGAGRLEITNDNSASLQNVDFAHTNGTLVVGDSGALGTSPALTVIDGTLELLADLVIAQLNQGQGAGTVELNDNALTIGGAVDSLFGGTINGTADSGLTIDVGAGQTVDFENVDFSNFSGGLSVLSGTFLAPDDLTPGGPVDNGGDFTVDADDTIIGGVNNAGSFTNDGTIDGDVTNDGLFGGGGMIDGNVTNRGRFGGSPNITGNFNNEAGGVLAPGDSIGTTVIGGDYDEAATLEIELNGVADGQAADLVDVAGTATFQNTATIVILPEDADDDDEPDTEDGNVTGGQMFTIVTAVGGITVPDADDLQRLGLTIDNQIAGVDFMFEFNGDMTELMLVAAAMDDVELTPQAFEAIFGATLDNVRVTNLGLAGYLNSRRLGMPSLGMTSNGGTPVGSMLAYNADEPEMLAAAMQAADEESAEGEAEEPGFIGVGPDEGRRPAGAGRWSAFARGIGVFQTRDSDGQRAGFDADSGGFMAGLDYETDSNLLVGVMFGYINTSVSMDLSRGSHDIDTFRVGPYASWSADPWFVDAALTYGYHNFDSTRRAGGQTLESDHDGHDISAFARVGYQWEMDSGLRITPEASLQYVYLSEESFSETGGLNALNVDSNASDSLRSRLGVTFSYPFERGEMTLVPEAFVGWEHEFLDEDDIDATFVGGGGGTSNFTGGEREDDSIVLAGGLSALLKQNLSAFIRYEGTFSDDNEVHGITGGVRLRF